MLWNPMFELAARKCLIAGLCGVIMIGSDLRSATAQEEGQPLLVSPVDGKPSFRIDQEKSAPRLQLGSAAGHNFGTMYQQKTGRHSFTLKNTGKCALTLELMDTSCGCTTVNLNGTPMIAGPLDGGLVEIPPGLSPPGILPGQPQTPSGMPLFQLVDFPPIAPPGEPALPRGTSVLKVLSNVTQNQLPFRADAPTVHKIAPGDTSQLEIVWETRLAAGTFHQSARIKTSDPAQPVVEFHIDGQVVGLVETSQPAIQLDALRSDRGGQATFYVFSKVLDNLPTPKLTTRSETIQIDFQPVTKKYLQGSGWKSGYEATVHVSAGLPIGELQELLIIATGVADLPEIAMPVRGRVEGGIRFISQPEFNLGVVLAAEGGCFGLVARLETDRPSMVKIIRVTPDWLECSAVTAKTHGSGAELLVLAAKVPAGSAAGDVIGMIELETTVSTARRIQIPVRGRILP